MRYKLKRCNSTGSKVSFNFRSKITSECIMYNEIENMIKLSVTPCHCENMNVNSYSDREEEKHFSVIVELIANCKNVQLAFALFTVSLIVGNIRTYHIFNIKIYN